MNFISPVRAISLIVITCVAAMCVSSVGRAAAIQSTAVSCEETGTKNVTTLARSSTNDLGARVNASAQDVWLLCPIARYENIDVHAVFLEGEENQENGIVAYGCVVYAGGFGGTCDSGFSYSGPGSVQISVLNNSWLQNPNDYRFIHALMKAAIGTNRNKIFGFRQVRCFDGGCPLR